MNLVLITKEVHIIVIHVLHTYTYITIVEKLPPLPTLTNEKKKKKLIVLYISIGAILLEINKVMNQGCRHNQARVCYRLQLYANLVIKLSKCIQCNIFSDIE